ncbi:nucleoside deaminase [Frankia sp. AgKG'84/4]|uniref:nucleoside deaminase n=1 Tax=Frankia sp. AgKG'84/4 TaxID=573490 RepID=UPI00202A86C4|nr:nucleoside deaminase [Frankia sp. AgKG'84/4]MCL9798104.1 nucleoside deaminase [Frankia sp. AgKG'84/4]
MGRGARRFIDDLLAGRRPRSFAASAKDAEEIRTAIALRAAAQAAGSWRLAGATLVVTLEPCTMCAGALVLARVARVVYGAVDDKAGAVGSLWDVVRDRRLNHRPEVIAGVRAEECGELLAVFFAARRRTRTGPGEPDTAAVR